jgi:flagellar biosynthetic protein FliR
LSAAGGETSRKHAVQLEFLQAVPVFVLVFIRLAAMTLSTPLFGASNIPRRVKLILAMAIAFGMAPGLSLSATIPSDLWTLTVGIGGEIIFGWAMGLSLSFIFTAVHWAGEIIGQQMGINLGEVFDPQFGQQGSVVGDLYYLLTLAVFLLVRGHHILLRAVYSSFASMPLLSAGMNRGVLDTMTGMLNGAMTMAFQLAAPILVTMLIVDLVLGFVGKTVPQFNLMSTGLSLRALVGIMILIVGLSVSSDVIRQSVLDSLDQVAAAWRRPAGS